jgi:GH35 family endo-1,4-beta-xylanase
MPDLLKHRKSPIFLRILNENRPAANRPVKIRQTGHEFLLGVCGFDAVALIGNMPDEAPQAGFKAFLRERLDRLFSVMNFATLPFYLGRYEPSEGSPNEARTLKAAEYFCSRGVKVKGHPLVWHTVCADWLMRYSNKEILEKLRRRIEREMTHFKGLIDIWDVINEVVIMPVFDKYDNAVTRVCKELGRVSMVREVFTTARAANPGATLLLNDFDLSAQYEILIDGCLQAGIPIDVIGIQSHQHQGYWGVQYIEEILERYSQFGLPIHFTENTIISGDIMPSHIVDLNDWQVDAWPSTPEGEERQAREMLEMYSILFAHPLVEAITAWSAVDGGWLKAPGGLLHEDNSVKPVFTELEKKIKGEWSTKAELSTNASGEITFEGFRGSYELECDQLKAAFTLDKKGGVVLVEL